MNKWIAEFELEDGDTMPEHMDLEYMGAKIDFHCKPLEQESKTGQWITKSHGFPPEPSSVCSECGFDRDFYIRSRGFDKINYCPNCGAKMAESEEDKELIVNKDVYDTLTEEQKKLVDIGLSYFNNRKRRRICQRKINSEM